MAVERRRARTQVADHRHCTLLRARRERPSRRAAEQRDELAASDESCHLIPPAGRLRPNDSTVERCSAAAVPFGSSRSRLLGLFRPACCRVRVICRLGSFSPAYR